MTTEATFAPKHAKTTPRQTAARQPATRRPPTRLRAILGLFGFGLYLLFHRRAIVPSLHLNVPVPAAPYDMKLAFLDGVADGYRTKAAPRFGCLVAERRFGPVTVEAHVKDEDYTRQLIALQDEQAAQAAGSAASA